MEEEVEFYKALYRKIQDQFHDEGKKYYNLLTKHNRLIDKYNNLIVANIWLRIFLGISVLINVVLIMLN